MALVRSNKTLPSMFSSQAAPRLARRCRVYLEPVFRLLCSLARRAESDARKFKVIAIYWSIALALILAAIPGHDQQHQ